MKQTEELLQFIENCPSPYHTVETCAKMLAEAGFSELSMGEEWCLSQNGQYFVKGYDSTLFAFRLGQRQPHGLRITASHTDFPCLRIKPAAEINTKGYVKLNVEPYGGMIYRTWLDRPLAIAGKVVVRGRDVFSPAVYLFDAARPLLTIPSLAIHMDRSVNEGAALNPQKHLLPLFTLAGEEADEQYLLPFLAAEMGIGEEDILAYELSLYPWEKGCCFGLQDEFISSPRLDNLTSVKACLDGLVEAKPWQGIKMAVFFDNEEVGSRTKQGAGSDLFKQVLERIYHQLGYSQEELYADLAAGMLLSVDVAHALHPNYPEKNDVTNEPVLNGGFVLKIAASQSYAGDAEAIAIAKGICEKAAVPYQIFVNRADMRGGSTLGSIASALLSLRTMDVGVPMLAMHSARETMGRDDQTYLQKFIQKFYML